MIRLSKEELHAKYKQHIIDQFKFKIVFESYSFNFTKLNKFDIREVYYDLFFSINEHKFIRTVGVSAKDNVEEITRKILNTISHVTSSSFREDFENMKSIYPNVYDNFSEKYTTIAKDVAVCLIENFNLNQVLD